MLRQGERIGPLRVERTLGFGGMGEVYLARDDRLERLVAIKLLPSGRIDQEARGRMLREARAASALKHPSIVTIYDVGEHDGRSFIVMEYVDGETFDELITRRGRLPPAEAVELIAQVASAVAAAHATGVLHRDLKSANLMIDGEGRVKVLDFGLSKRTEGHGGISRSQTPVPVSGPPRVPPPEIDVEAQTVAPGADDSDDFVGNAATATPLPAEPPATAAASTERDDEPHTQHGARMGTPGWAPPELIDGRGADVRSDVFALGCVLYHLLAGRPPFHGTNWTMLRTQIETGPRPPSRFATDVPPSLDAVVLSALAEDPDHRPSDAPALVAAPGPR